jgi:hypothetical protein
MSTGSSKTGISGGNSTSFRFGLGISNDTQTFFVTVLPSFLVLKIVSDVTTIAESISPSIMGRSPRFRLPDFLLMVVEKKEVDDKKGVK